MSKYKTRLYIVEAIVLGLKIFGLAIISVNGFQLFMVEFNRMILISTTAFIVLALDYIRYRNKGKIKEAIEEDLAYKTETQVIFDLRRGEIVCFRLADDLGTLKIIEEDSVLLMHMQNHHHTMSKDIEDEKNLVHAVKGLMNITKLFKNGVIFHAEIVEVDNMDDMIEMGKGLKEKGE